LLPRCRTYASEGRAAASLLRSFPNEREPRSPSQRRLREFMSVPQPKSAVQVQSMPVFSCKQQEKNRGSERRRQENQREIETAARKEQAITGP
jgi:hypothetical protein